MTDTERKVIRAAADVCQNEQAFVKRWRFRSNATLALGSCLALTSLVLAMDWYGPNAGGLIGVAALGGVFIVAGAIWRSSISQWFALKPFLNSEAIFKAAKREQL